MLDKGARSCSCCPAPDRSCAVQRRPSARRAAGYGHREISPRRVHGPPQVRCASRSGCGATIDGHLAKSGRGPEAGNVPTKQILHNFGLRPGQTVNPRFVMASGPTRGLVGDEIARNFKADPPRPHCIRHSVTKRRQPGWRHVQLRLNYPRAPLGRPYAL